jgi:hypothetical protein
LSAYGFDGLPRELKYIAPAEDKWRIWLVMVVLLLSLCDLLVRYIGIPMHYMCRRRCRVCGCLVGWVSTLELGLQGLEQIVKTWIQDIRLAEAPGTR